MNGPNPGTDVPGADPTDEDPAVTETLETSLEAPDPDSELAPQASPNEDPAAEDHTPEEVAGPTLATLQSGLEELYELCAAQSARAEFYEGQVRQLQARVETLQNDQLQQLLMPALQRLAILHTEAINAAQQAKADPTRFQAEIEFDYFTATLTESLALLGFDIVTAAQGVPFDRNVHASRKTVTTSDTDLDGCIAKVFRQGLIRDGSERAFLPAQVSVYRATDVPPTPPEPLNEIVSPTTSTTLDQEDPTL